MQKIWQGYQFGSKSFENLVSITKFWSAQKIPDAQEMIESFLKTIYFGELSQTGFNGFPPRPVIWVECVLLSLQSENMKNPSQECHKVSRPEYTGSENVPSHKT